MIIEKLLQLDIFKKKILEAEALYLEAPIRTVYFTVEKITFDLIDGRTITAPLGWYPFLEKATPDQRNEWELCGGGTGVYWPKLDEYLSSKGLLKGLKAPGGPIIARSKESPASEPVLARPATIGS